jgi:hypothetical protein
MHMSYAPVDRERRVMYTDFTLPSPVDDETATESGGAIARVREQAYKTVSQAPGYVA